MGGAPSGHLCPLVCAEYESFPLDLGCKTTTKVHVVNVSLMTDALHITFKKYPSI